MKTKRQKPKDTEDMTANNDRYRNKVRKLLALAESSNPHEAERALSQAKKIMAKYNISAEDSEIIEVAARPIPRKRLNDYEHLLVACIREISGCEIFLKARRENHKWNCHPLFVGVTSDASMAAYCFDVLYSQLIRYQNDLKKEFKLSSGDRNVASKAWVKSACRKLLGFFDRRPVPEHVSDFYGRRSEGVSIANFHKTKKSNNSNFNEALEEHGSQHGRQALLNKAADHQKRDVLSSA